MNLAYKISASCTTAVVLLIANGSVASDPPKKEARVTQIIRDVKLLRSDAPPRPAAENEQVSENTAVRTGDESRSELTFEDLTITRLGANTIFSFNKAGRSGRLDSGSILLRVPKDSGGGEFRTNAVTVGITGTTFIFESTRLGNSKLIVLEGAARLALVKYPRQTRNVRAGQMLDVKAGATKLPLPVKVDLERIMRSPLITDFPPLPSQDLILAVIKDQQASASGGPPASQGRPITPNAPTPAPGGPGIPTLIPPPQPTVFPTSTPLLTPTPTPGRLPTPQPTSTPTPTPTVLPTRTPQPETTPTPKVSPTRTPPPRATPTPRALPTRTPRPKRTPTPTPTPRVILTRTPTPTPKASTRYIPPSQGGILQPPARTVKPSKKGTPSPSPSPSPRIF